LVRLSIRIFEAYHGQRRLRRAQPEGFTRRIFFDPSLSFDPTTLKPRFCVGAEALASSHKKWSAQLSYYATMTEMGRRHKRSARVFFVASIPRRRELRRKRH
jgi:hypothetical protein